MEVESHKQFTQLCELRSKIPTAIDPILLTWLRHAAAAGTFHIFTDGVGRPIGYVVWAAINRESALRLAQFKTVPRYGYEWEEGRITLILDFLIVNRTLLSARQALKQFLRKRRAVAVVRRSSPRFYLRRGSALKRVKTNLLCSQ